MAAASVEEDVAPVRELMSRCTLSAIEYHELSAKWTGQRTDEELTDIDVSINLQHRLSTETFGIRMTGEVNVPFGESRSVVAAVYSYDGQVPELRTVLAFANEVAVMTLLPYLRESISTITAKVFGEPLLLPIIPRGELGFELDEMATPLLSPGE